MCQKLVADMVKKYPIIPQFIKFALIGFMNFFIDLAVLNALMLVERPKRGDILYGFQIVFISLRRHLQLLFQQALGLSRIKRKPSRANSFRSFFL